MPIVAVLLIGVAVAAGLVSRAAKRKLLEKQGVYLMERLDANAARRDSSLTKSQKHALVAMDDSPTGATMTAQI